MTIAMDMTRIPITQAATAAGLPAPLLRHLVAYELIPGGCDLCDLDEAQLFAQRINDARTAVDGNPLLISDAAERYGFSSRSIYNWISAGWVRVLVEEPRRKVDEGDMATARFLANLIGHVPGRAIFPPKPRPGRPKKSR